MITAVFAWNGTGKKAVLNLKKLSYTCLSVITLWLYLMASRNCKFRSLMDWYEHFPLVNRFGGDQVPLELNRRDFTLDLQGTTDPVHIRGPKKDIDKRQATIQLFVWVEGEQIVKPTLILRSANPAFPWWVKRLEPNFRLRISRMRALSLLVQQGNKPTKP